jgi:hypothetical protein
LVTRAAVARVLKLTTRLLIIFAELDDLVDDFLPLQITCNWLWHLNIISCFLCSFIVQGKEAIVESELCIISLASAPISCLSYKGIFRAPNMGNVHVVGGRTKVLQLLLGKDVFGNEMNLCVSMLSCLGGRHVDDLARTALDEDVATLSQGRALHGVGQ